MCSQHLWIGETQLGIDWDQSKIVGQEQDTTQRKMLEGVDTIKKKSRTDTTELIQSNGELTTYYILFPSKLLLIFYVGFFGSCNVQK